MYDEYALLLARIQFAFTISFHIIFPAITIGLASYLVILEGMWLKSKNQVYLNLYDFWLKVFAVNFGMGVVSGLVMAYQFGTNWAGFSNFAGSITGPLLTYEVLTAFFLEAGFLGVMIYGRQKVGPGLHYFATIMVATGTIISTFWILASNSWMQTPQGIEIINGQVIPVDWFAVIFNPSFPYRLVHMTVAAFVATSFFVAASAAWHLLRGNRTAPVKKMLSMAMWMALISACVQVVVGDLHGLNTLKHQPAKIAAMEGHWENEGDKATPLILFGIPDNEAERTKYKLEIPALGSLILTHSLDKQVPALKDFPKDERANSFVVFWTFRIMAGLGFLMVIAGFWSLWLRKKGSLFDNKYFLRFILLMGPSGLIAILAGWFTTEVGRQPWIVYGLMKTKDAVTLHPVGHMSLSLGLFVVSYFLLFGIGIYYMLQIVRKGPNQHSEHLPFQPHNLFTSKDEEH